MQCSAKATHLGQRPGHFILSCVWLPTVTLIQMRKNFSFSVMGAAPGAPCQHVESGSCDGVCRCRAHVWF